MSCGHLKFSADNFIEDSAVTTLTASPQPVTDLNYVRNDEAAEVAKWTNQTGHIIIEGTMDEPIYASYLALLDNNLSVSSFARLELFYDKDDATPYYDTLWQPTGEAIPVGVFRVGIDPYGVFLNEPLNSVKSIWFDGLQLVGKWRLSIDPAFTYVEPVATTTTTEAVTTTETVPDGVYRQSDAGVLSLECESSPDVTTEGQGTWVKVDDSSASSGYAMYNNQSDIYAGSDDGPRFSFIFTAANSGNHDVWARVKSTEGNSVYCVVDGNAKYKNTGFHSSYTWVHLRTCTLVAEQQHALSIAARDHYMYFDKIVVQTAGAAEPTGTGPIESGEGTTTTTTVTNGSEVTTYTSSSSNSVQIRMLMMGNTLKMENNFNYGSVISFLTPPDLHQMHDGKYKMSRPQKQARRLSLDLSQMTEIDRYNLWEMESRLKGKPFLVSAYPDRADWYTGNYIFLARFVSELNYIDKNVKYHGTSLELVEA